MHHQFWHDRWTLGEIGFHQDEIHPLLIEFWARLSADDGSRVLVPLCGKSRDMVWIADQGPEVVGAELSEIAVQDFFEENKLESSVDRIDGFARYRAQNLTILAGDFFELTTEAAGSPKFVYDRAALIALPEEMRSAYVEQLSKLMPTGARCLLITIEYEPDSISGPPFLVTPSEVHRHFDPWARVERLGGCASTVKGLKCQEAAYLITSR